MKISNETIELLKNFATLNSNMLILEGSKQLTKTTNSTVCAVADFPQEFPKEFGVYELPKLLGAIKLFENAELDFISKERAVIIKDSNSKFSYYGTPKENLSIPKGIPKFPDEIEQSFVLPKDVLVKMKTVGMPYISFESVDGVLRISTSDISNPSSNVYEHILNPDSGFDDFEVHFKTEHLQMINGEYNVDISSKVISRFSMNLDEKRKLDYYVAFSNEKRASKA